MENKKKLKEKLKEKNDQRTGTAPPIGPFNGESDLVKMMEQVSALLKTNPQMVQQISKCVSGVISNKDLMDQLVGEVSSEIYHAKTPETHQEDVVEDSQEIVMETPEEVVVETLQEDVVETAQETVVETPQEAVVETPQETLVETAQEAVVETLQEVVVETPQEVVQVDQTLESSSLGDLVDASVKDPKQ